MAVSIDYAFTVTLQPKLFKQEPEHQYDLTYNHVRQMIGKISRKFTLVSELTKSYNIHYHGIISFTITPELKDCRKLFYKTFRNDIFVGFVNIKQIDNYPKWSEYISKDITQQTVSINRRPIIWDDYEIFSSDQRFNFGCQF